MKGKKLSNYAVAAVFFVLGMLATLAIFSVATNAKPEQDYDAINPADLDADFGH